MTIALFNLEDFVNVVRDKFDFLFKKYDYDLLQTCSARSNEHMQIIIGSGCCRLRFQYDLGYIEISIGPNDAPLGWAKDPFKESDWIPVEALFEFLDKKRQQTQNELLEADEAMLDRGEIYLTYVAKKIRQRYREIELFFQK